MHRPMRDAEREGGEGDGCGAPAGGVMQSQAVKSEEVRKLLTMAVHGSIAG